MDLSRILQPDYCNSLLKVQTQTIHTSFGISEKEATETSWKAITTMQIVTALIDTAAAPHMQSCLNKIATLTSLNVYHPFEGKHDKKYLELFNEAVAELK
jgi:hypothetical protein